MSRYHDHLAGFGDGEPTAPTMTEADGWLTCDLDDPPGHWVDIRRHRHDSLFQWDVTCSCGETWLVKGVRREAERCRDDHLEVAA